MESKKLLVYGEMTERQQILIDFLIGHGYTVEQQGLLVQYQGRAWKTVSELDTWASLLAEQVADESMMSVIAPKNDPYYRKESRKGGKRW